MSEQIYALIDAVPGIVLTFGAKLLVALLIYLVGKWVATGLAKLLKKGLEKGKVDASLTHFLGNITYAVIMIFVIIAAISRLGVQTTSFVAIVGASTLAIGMAMQGTLGNFSAGVMLIVFKPFKLGDSVIAAGVTGVVHDIGIFQTIIIPSDGRKVMIPNGKLSNDTITNFSSLPTRRVELNISVPGNSDIASVRDILRSVMESESDGLKEPAPSIVITDANAGTINFGMHLYVKTADYSKVHSSMVEKVKLALNHKGIWA